MINNLLIVLCESKSKVKFIYLQAGIEESKTGWIGNGGVTFRPIQYNSETNEYLTIQSDPQGYWHVVLVNAEVGFCSVLTIFEGLKFSDCVNGGSFSINSFHKVLPLFYNECYGNECEYSNQHYKLRSINKLL